LNMMNPQLALYDEELTEIREVADRLHQDSRARTILIVDKNGQLIASSGVDAELDTTSLSSLVAGNVAATGGIAKLIEEEEFTGQFHEGKEISVHMTIVARRIILVVLFDKNTTQGLVRLRVKKANEALADIFERIAAKPKNEQDDVFKEITDDDIDALFGP
jgi:predicted regulator of Ras-like GTPase activity (Roadblock/LC7/MglB family)